MSFLNLFTNQRKKTAKSWTLSPLSLFITLAIFALILRILTGACIYTKPDVIWFHLPWAKGIQPSLFEAYTNVASLDYPPFFPFLLYTLSGPVLAADAAGFQGVLMFLLKLYPILADIGIACAVFFLLRKDSEPFALACGCFWLLNPSSFFSSAVWGQSDTLLLFCLLLLFWMLYRRRPVWAGLFFALGCLCKLQMLYFTPIILCELLCFYKPRVWVKSIGLGFTLFAAGWLPFIIGSKNIRLPLDIYWGGLEKYNHITLNAANVYGISPGFNFRDADAPFFGPVSANSFSQAALLVFVLGVVLLWLWMRQTGRRTEAAIPALLYINLIFMFTTKMHERYQLPAMMLSFVCLMIVRSRFFFGLTCALTATTLFNQMVYLLCWIVGEPIGSWKDTCIQWISYGNIVLLLVMVVSLIGLLLDRPVSQPPRPLWKRRLAKR